MNARETAILRKHHRFLLDHIDSNIIRHHLYEKDILTRDDMEVLAMPDKTRSYKNEILLLHILPRRGPSAYAKFLDCLREEDGFSHVVDILENTELSEGDHQENFTSRHHDAIHLEVNTLYAEVKMGRTTLDATEDESHASRELTLPADTFQVQLKSTTASERCRFESGTYLINFSENGVGIIELSEYMSNQLEDCTMKALWDYPNIRRYSEKNDKCDFFVEAGRSTCTGEGMFHFKTRNLDDLSQMLSVLHENKAKLRKN